MDALAHTPDASESLPAASARLAGWLTGQRIAILGGAGMSTESGIPDYRSAGRTPPRPITHLDFIRREEARRRYWARSFIGWPRFEAARPNVGHVVVAQLEAAGLVTGLITQNVDGLHGAAGSRAVIELHGSLARVRCLGCGGIEARAVLQDRLAELNRGWLGGGVARPDGDADVLEQTVASFRLPACVSCGGTLKPDVVFFGDNVQRAVVDAAYQMVDAASRLLVLGTSLTVWSGYRFVRRAAERGIPVLIVNQGPTRGDPVAALRIEQPLGPLLTELACRLTIAPGVAGGSDADA